MKSLCTAALVLCAASAPEAGWQPDEQFVTHQRVLFLAGLVAGVGRRRLCDELSRVYHGLPSRQHEQPDDLNSARGRTGDER